MKTIIISGKSGSGKDTFANIMREKLESTGKRCVTIHFADLVKHYLTDYYGWNGEKDEAGRTMLQSLGTDKMRSLIPEYWAETVAKFLAVAAYFNDFDVAFIPDARFPNEIETVFEFNQNSVSIRIERYNENGSMYLNPTLTDEQRNHPSEVSLDKYPFDYIVENHNMDDFITAAETVLKDIGLLN